MPDERPTGLQPYLTLALRHRIGSLHLDVAFELTQPWTILFGPSGSGKTTILRAIAGLLTPQSGRIVTRQNTETLTLLNSETGENVPTRLRRTPLAPQRGKDPCLALWRGGGIGQRRGRAHIGQDLPVRG